MSGENQEDIPHADEKNPGGAEIEHSGETTGEPEAQSEEATDQPEAISGETTDQPEVQSGETTDQPEAQSGETTDETEPQTVDEPGGDVDQSEDQQENVEATVDSGEAVQETAGEENEGDEEKDEEKDEAREGDTATEPTTQAVTEDGATVEATEPTTQVVTEDGATVEATEPTTQVVTEDGEPVEATEPTTQVVTEDGEPVETTEPTTQVVTEDGEPVEATEPVAEDADITQEARSEDAEVAATVTVPDAEKEKVAQDDGVTEPEVQGATHDAPPAESGVKGQEVKTEEQAATVVPDTTPAQVQETGVVTDATPGQVHETDPHAPSPTGQSIFEATATVKFVLMPSGQVATMACTLGQSLKQLKEHFASELKMPVNLILLMFDGSTMADTTTLADLGVGPNGSVQLELQSADPVNTPIKPYKPRLDYQMPDVITVRVQTDDDGAYKDIVVEIERTARKQRYMGGYRNKKTGVEYLHAAAQTLQKQRPQAIVERFCRDTQTVELQHNLQQTTNNMSTQMTGIGVYVSNINDKLVTPRKYTTAYTQHCYILGNVLTIQKYYRRWLAKRYVAKLRADKKRRLEWEQQMEMNKRREKENRIKQEFERRMNPKSKGDFDLLYHALEKWRAEELDRIDVELTGAERKAALYMLLEQETQLISAIGRHQLEADSENKDKRIQKFLQDAASPKCWKAFDGKVTEMDTPYTIRAKELSDIYNSINMRYLTQDERLDVLLTLKHTVKEHDCRLTQEVIELIDREADLLTRGIKETNLEGLRKRISTLFLQYIKTPTFNPEAARLLKVPQDPSTLRKNVHYCPSCNGYLPSVEFALSSNSRSVGRCRRCARIDNEGRARQDLSHYRYMLRKLRKQEEDYNDASRIAFLLQESDLQYLVENVWSSQSVLSAWEDLFDLTIPRWDKHEEWAPWNCILITRDEASAHEKLDSLDEGYGNVFIQKVKQKHTLARNYFSRLPGMAEHIRAKANQRDMPCGPAIAGQAVFSRA